MFRINLIEEARRDPVHVLSRRALQLSRLIAVGLLVYLVSVSSSVYAIGGKSGPDTSQIMREAQALIKKKKYPQALKKLRRVVNAEPYDADAWSLIGFSERKEARLEKAEAAYNRALTLDPNHKGALSYQGELFLQQNRPELAEENRKRLESLCPEGCKALDALNAALSGDSTDKSLDY